MAMFHSIDSRNSVGALRRPAGGIIHPFHRNRATRKMSKLPLIDTFSHRVHHRPCSSKPLPFVASLLTAGLLCLAGPAAAQEAADDQPVYPKAVTTSGDSVFVVDLDLPGVWQLGDSRTLYAKGSNLLRKPMNRPHCLTPHPEGGLLVGDSATREVYWIQSADAEPKPLSGGRIGIPMALAVDPSGKVLYVGDAEKRATFRLPIEGGEPELVARVNARGFAFDNEGRLLAVTPDKEAIRRIDLETEEVETIVERPNDNFFSNGICWAGDHGFVTDNYGNCIWKFTEDGKIEKWHEGEPLQRPVGIAISGDALFVADPHPEVKQVFEFDLKTKESKPRL